MTTPDSALTCDACRSEPVTTLVVFDVGAKGCKAPVRVMKLIGATCLKRGGWNDPSGVSITPASAWMWTLTPVMEPANV